MNGNWGRWHALALSSSSSMVLSPSVRSDDCKLRRRHLSPPPLFLGGARRRMETTAFPSPRRHEDSSLPSAALCDDNGRFRPLCFQSEPQQ
nr:hypothetical protein Iba_scaffold13384CG0010 [Ipomoea batatas]